MESHRTSVVLRDMDSPKKETLLRVSPAELRFQDALARRVYRLPITVHNLSRGNLKIRFHEPVKPQFKLAMTDLDKSLAPGLQMTVMVEYHPDKDVDVYGVLLISTGDKKVEIPLTGLIPCCELHMVSEINFGKLVSNNKVHSREIRLTNHGLLPGQYEAKYEGELPIVISPTSSIVNPRSSIAIKIDFCADQPGVVNEVISVSLQDQPKTLLTIKANVVSQIIELLSINHNTRLDSLRFGPVYFGTAKIEQAFLHNNSSEPLNWVAIMHDDSIGAEVGTNIHQRTDVTISNLNYVCKLKNMDISAFISCIPNEGRLLPYQKTMITFCFNPKLIIDGKKITDPSHRQDYAVFLRFESLGSKEGFLRDDYCRSKCEKSHRAELAVTGSGLPVLLDFDTGKVFNFSSCYLGERSDIMCVMQNQSRLLPVTYRFKRTAHFKVNPEKGKINEGCIQNLTCSFIPHQIGIFQVKQIIEIIGPVADRGLQSTSLKVFHHLALEFNGVCHSTTKKVVMEVNTGISPLVSNPTGHFVAKDAANHKDYPRAAVLQSKPSHSGDPQSDKEPSKTSLLAFPNDRAGSIRPAEQDKEFRTIFTKTPRYTYLDPEYEYTDNEKMEKEIHKKHYVNYIDKLRDDRLRKQSERKAMLSQNDRAGLKLPSTQKSHMPTKVKTEAGPSSKVKTKESHSVKSLTKSDELLTTSKIAVRETRSLKRKVLKAIKKSPSTPHEKRDCKLTLTPKQIHQVIVGPSTLNFDHVCVNSTNTLSLHVINMLSTYIWVQLIIDVKELKKTNQLSYVIPPVASASLLISFESSNIGNFLKSFNFTVNNVVCGHILVTAVVHPVKLELSSNELILRPHGFFINSCFRETVRLYNHHNYFAEFEWQPVNTKRGITFSICPTQGTVEPYSCLECEVKWQPGYNSTEKGEFILRVPDGSTETLKCIAHVGNTKVLFLEPRILFSNIAQGLTSWRKAILHNIGQNHAYFKVSDQDLLPTVKIFPSEGIIPLGGLAVLNISCSPTVAEKFDTKAKVTIRRSNVIDLRISGTVDIADIEIIPNSYKFNGTYVGTTQAIPFLIKNNGLIPARVEFNLVEFPAFKVEFADKSVEHSDPKFPGIYFVEVEEKANMECAVTFSPMEVRTFEFTFHISINYFKASELYLESCLSEFPQSQKTMPLIQPCHIQATVLQSPLTLSSTEFILEAPLHAFDSKAKVTETKDLILNNTSNRDVKWKLDVTNADKLFKDKIFHFSSQYGLVKAHQECCISISFNPKRSTKYTADIPLYLNDIPICYQTLSLSGDIKSPKLVFDPPFVFFAPIPLNVTTVMEIKILPENYYRNSSLHVHTPATRLLDGDEISPLSVVFPKENAVTGSSNGINDVITCHLKFSSPKPVSFSSNIVFSDYRDSQFSLPVIAIAENCILTVYPYMATHIDKQKYVVKDVVDTAPSDLQLVSIESGLFSSLPSRSNNANIENGLFVGVEMTAEKLKSSESETSEHEENVIVETEEKNEQFFFPEEGTAPYNFFAEVIRATETWFSLFGWPEGPHTLSIPETIRRDVYKLQFHSSAVKSKTFIRQNDFSKYNKTIYDVMFNLTGKLLPGVNATQSLPVNDIERVIQLYNQHTSLLEFLNLQGASIANILPEFLLEPDDYVMWLEITSSKKSSLSSKYCIPRKRHPIVIDKTKFEDWSKRAWTDVLLQIYKVLVLSRVVPYSGKNIPLIQAQNSPKVQSRLTSSNIYSKNERTLLSWLNTNYENGRHIIWENSEGIIPPEKWILNFDRDLSDGLVLAAQLGVYCPYLNDSFFIDMYTQPTRFEHYTHNCLIIVSALQEIGFEMDIQASDIYKPNPILMLMLCVYMYERLPTYLPKKVVSFSCNLHETVPEQIILTNPSLRSVVYNASIIGRDASNFFLSQHGHTITISPKNKVDITVKFNGRFLHPAEALLLLISKAENKIGGITMAFALRGEINNFNNYEIINCKSPCYRWKEISLKVTNPFNVAGHFNVILVESSTFISSPSQIIESEQYLSQVYQGDKTTSTNENDIAADCSPYPSPLRTSINSSILREFFCSTPTFKLGLKGASLDLFYLPFGTHVRFCVVILSNKEIGELIYVLEGEGTLPLPTSFLPVDYSGDRYYSGCPEKEVNKDDPVLYLSCGNHQVLEVDLKFPLTNEAKEKALAFAAQKLMSETEYERRAIIGTLESSSVRVAVALLGLTEIQANMLLNPSILKKPESILYKLQLSLPTHYVIPEEIYIPSVPQTRSECKIVADDFVTVPLRFTPFGPGRYPCRILLASAYDLRVYSIEGVVNDKHTEIIFNFVTPAFEAITQNIPIHNDTKKEWKCKVQIEGEWFYGPPAFNIRAGETLQYPLTFKPGLECEIKGKLVIKNEGDGMEHKFQIRGVGKKPIALEHIYVSCQVGNLSNRTIMVPNSTKDVVTYKVTTDLQIIWGKPLLTIPPDSVSPYLIQINPWRRGLYKGTIAFSLKSRGVDDTEAADNNCMKKLEQEVFNLDKKISDYDVTYLKLWYHIEIRSNPAPPVEVMEMQCIALENFFFEIPLSNPDEKDLHLDVVLSNASLNGVNSVKLEGVSRTTYLVQYSTASTGLKEESIIFLPDHGPEFWYLLKLSAGLPKPIVIPEVYCNLGKYTAQIISLVNPTHEVLQLEAVSTNPDNFALFMTTRKVTVRPYSIEEVCINFSPSSLGRTGHQSCIIFSCPQIKEWRFYLSGVGIFPEPLEVERITTFLHLHASIILPFQNPTNEDVLVNLILTFPRDATLVTKRIPLPPKGNLNIPLLFIPNVMKLHKTVVVVQLTKANGQNWTIDNFDELTLEQKRMIGVNTGEIQSIYWLYPILGLPQAIQHKTPQVVISCQARKRVEEEVEVALGGEFRGQNPIFESKDFTVNPRKNSENVYEDIIESQIKRDFEYEFLFESDIMKSNLESCLSAYLIRKYYDSKTEKIFLTFNVVFAPKKPLRTEVILNIECITDGIWKYPITLIADEPEVDYIIDIESVGLFKESFIDFKLTSQTSNPEPFTAYFQPGSDPVFSVKPASGILLPYNTEGTLIVVGFKPQMYSKRYKALLVIQTADIYLLYEVNGLPPITTPPIHVKPKVDSTNRLYYSRPVQQRNFLRENTRVVRTGVSSTIKGMPLMLKKK
ncbi:cilia- and flagella-associated protein 47 [Erinaceus europaeus]|uniref:Cilia- and flagella-associated protein 47 n=1 Tax=Erinaceus europaeus TaxID=9365 RepID=A0ABM3WQ20_ERIEU|nr:cilia- and flagella-associated protein 47 [Erinaceus europaeus]